MTHLRCPACGAKIKAYRNPIPTVDVIIEMADQDDSTRIVLVERLNPPPGWALPGGFVDYGESLERATVREAAEETGLEVELIHQLHTYSDPERDPRHHTNTTVNVGRGRGHPRAGDDAARVRLFDPAVLPEQVAFDHRRIIQDYMAWRQEEGDDR